MHVIARVLDALPKRLQPDATKLLREMMEVPTSADGRKVLERFREAFDAEYPKAAAQERWRRCNGTSSRQRARRRQVRGRDPGKVAA